MSGEFEWSEEIRELPLLPSIESPILHVDIDALALLVHFDGDELRVFDFLGKLKDLFAPIPPSPTNA